jgi:hypothetical protein
MHIDILSRLTVIGSPVIANLLVSSQGVKVAAV